MIRRLGLLSAAALLIALSIALITLTMQAARAFKPGTALAFSSTRNGSANLYLLDIERDWLRPLTRFDAPVLYPAFSPDGARIAFTARLDGSDDIFVMNLDGTGLRRLTGHPASESLPIWTPDGSQIAFISDWRGLPTAYLIDVNSPSSAPLWQPITSTRAYFDHFGVSPDRAMIAYVSAQDGKTDIFTRARSGSETRITELGSAFNPIWSPDSQWIAFESIAGGSLDIYIAPADGSAPPINLTDHPAPDYSPAWSPDGRAIAFVSNRTGSDDIYLITVDGRLLRRLTHLSGTNLNPVWLP
jgi:TolB protein